MMCLYCAQNRPVRASDGFYSARCARGYPHQEDGCAGFVERSEDIEKQPNYDPSSEAEYPLESMYSVTNVTT